MDPERRARAARKYREVTTSDPPPPTDAYLETTLDAVFGDVWTRPGLSRKERRWISLTCASCDGARVARESHMRAALASGDVSRQEMLEFVLQFAHYAGWPRSSELYAAFQAICAELDASGGTGPRGAA
jgi:4-carboxymuconolactone decarboxylase